MGLTAQATGRGALRERFLPAGADLTAPLIALAGNPNTGKSTLFNALTGLKQHTGNWPGKTVLLAEGRYLHQGQFFRLVDLPGTYSLLAGSVEEEIARDFLLQARPDVTIVVADATCLERNLNLVFQVCALTPRVVVCLNLLDEARKKGIKIDIPRLASELGVPVVGTAARSGEGIKTLMETVVAVASGKITPQPRQLLADPEINALLRKAKRDGAQGETIPLPSDSDSESIIAVNTNSRGATVTPLLADEARDRFVTAAYRTAESLAAKVVSRGGPARTWDRRLDDLLTSPWTGLPLMLLLLGGVLWLTLVGANYPSALLGNGFAWLEDRLTHLCQVAHAPAWLYGVLVLGLYRTLSWVVAVMLPPMAIFFPLFTLAEDLGLLPRIAFNLDHFFKRACAHGKQALTMCMGFGCNAAGVTACRIIDSPRERLLAVLTNTFVPCNGRFPTLIALSATFFGGGGLLGPLGTVGGVAAIILLGVGVTLLWTRFLSATLLRGLPSTFTLELPPYRLPQVGRILAQSFLDRTFHVLSRAVTIAAPAGALTWILANIMGGGQNLIGHIAGYLDPLGRTLGLDGVILLAFFLGLPANEIVLPIILMSYLGAGAMVESGSLITLKEVLTQHGWTWITALNVMLFSLLHFPCGTTLWTIYKETRSGKWTVLGALLPLGTAMLVCFLVTQVLRLF